MTTRERPAGVQDDQDVVHERPRQRHVAAVEGVQQPEPETRRSPTTLARCTADELHVQRRLIQRRPDRRVAQELERERVVGVLELAVPRRRAIFSTSTNVNFCGTPAATSDPNQPSQATPTVSSCVLSQRSWSDPRPLTSETMDSAAAASRRPGLSALRPR